MHPIHSGYQQSLGQEVRHDGHEECKHAGPPHSKQRVALHPLTWNQYQDHEQRNHTNLIATRNVDWTVSHPHRCLSGPSSSYSISPFPSIAHQRRPGPFRLGHLRLACMGRWDMIRYQKSQTHKLTKSQNHKKRERMETNGPRPTHRITRQAG